jgi:hypothetical protein
MADGQSLARNFVRPLRRRAGHNRRFVKAGLQVRCLGREAHGHFGVTRNSCELQQCRGLAREVILADHSPSLFPAGIQVLRGEFVPISCMKVHSGEGCCREHGGLAPSLPEQGDDARNDRGSCDHEDQAWVLSVFEGPCPKLISEVSRFAVACR